MDATTKTALVIAFAIVIVLLLLFGGGTMTGATLSGGMMGSGAMGGVSWMWLPTVLVVVLGVVLFSVIVNKKYGARFRRDADDDRADDAA